MFQFSQYIARPRRWLHRMWRIHPDLMLALALAIGLIVVGLAMGWNNVRVVPRAPSPDFNYLSEPHNPLSFFANWDGPDYIHIAEHGYETLFWVNWFPLYPIAIWAVHHVVSSALGSAFLVSWVCLPVALYFYVKIVRRLFGPLARGEALQALSYFALFPTAMFLIAPFSESLYAALALGAIHYALERRTVRAAVLLALCTATHITGPFVVILVILLLRELGMRWRTVLTVAAIGSLGAATYAAYLYDYYDRPLGFLDSQQIYHHWTHYGFLNLITSAGPFNVVCVVAVIVSMRYWWHRRRSLAVYSALFLLILVAGRQYGGFNRYMLMAFPVQFMLFEVVRRHKALYPYVLVALGSMWTYYLMQYAGGYIGS